MLHKQWFKRVFFRDTVEDVSASTSVISEQTTRESSEEDTDGEHSCDALSGSTVGHVYSPPQRSPGLANGKSPADYLGSSIRISTVCRQRSFF
jgi:hypothetical protein